MGPPAMLMSQGCATQPFWNPAFQVMYKDSYYKGRWSGDCIAYIMVILIPEEAFYWNWAMET